MKFSFETQAAITYLVAELEPSEVIDSLTLGMLTNNRIVGVAPVLYTEMNGQRFLKYNISAKITADQFFSGSLSRERALQAFQSILNALCVAEDYMIDQNCFSVRPEHIFLNVSSCETALICLPVVAEQDINVETAVLFKKILFSTQFDQSEDISYVGQLITYVNGPTFSVYGFRDLVAKLQSSAVNTRSAAPVIRQSPVQDLNATISIDDMASGRQNQMQEPAHVKPVVQPPVQQPIQPPVQQPVRPPVQPPIQPPVQQPVRPPVQQPGQMNIPPRPNGGASFPIPGQTPAIPSAQHPPVPVSQAPQTGGKKMSLFGLLSHYNKDNAAAYKAQKNAEKEAKKAQKEAKKSQKNAGAANVPGMPTPPGVPYPGAASVNGQHPMPGWVPVNGQPSAPGRPPMGVQPSQPYTVPQQSAVMQPVPVQSSFNETTVLSSFAGETTVLSAQSGPSEPYLIRVRSGERIFLNKPVFRIGKEKSYVDYFIGDNTAVSRSHCNIHTENGCYYIEDTNSTNHTYVNGQIINSNVKVKLSSGDKIRLANEDFVFSL